MTTRLARFCAAAASSVALVIAVGGLPAWGQATPAVKVEPNSGAPNSIFRITMSNYKACPAAQPNCITIDFIQGSNPVRIGTANSQGAPTFSGDVRVPPTAVGGPAEVRASSTTGDDARTAFTVVGAAPTTTLVPPASTTTTTTVPPATTTVAPTTTSTSSTSSTSTTIASTTTTLKKDDTSSHSDAPRYIAVALVVLAAGATAGVDTYLRRLKTPAP